MRKNILRIVVLLFIFIISITMSSFQRTGKYTNKLFSILRKYHEALIKEDFYLIKNMFLKKKHYKRRYPTYEKYIKKQKRDFYKLIKEFKEKYIKISKCKFIGIGVDVMVDVKPETKNIARLQYVLYEKMFNYHFNKIKKFNKLDELDLYFKTRENKYISIEIDIAVTENDFVIMELDDDVQTRNSKVKMYKMLTPQMIEWQIKRLKRLIKQFEANPRGFRRKRGESAPAR